MKKVKLGIAGCGDVAQKTYFPGIAEVLNVEIMAVCDTVEERVKLAKDWLKAREHYTDYNEMLQKADIEAVLILTPMQLHARMALAAIEAGKAAYTEKVMATTVEDADQLIEEAKKANVMLASAPAVMLSPVNRQIKNLVQKGAIGKTCLVRAQGSHEGPGGHLDRITDPTWFYKKGAGPVFDLAVYALHTITGILGPAKSVTALSGITVPEVVVAAGEAKGRKIEVEMDDNTVMLIDFGDATFAMVNGSFRVQAAKGPRMEFYGTQGTINVGGSREAPFEMFRNDEAVGFKGWATPAPPPMFLQRKRWGLASGVEHMADCMLHDKELVLTPEHARHVIEIMTKCYDAAREGCTLELQTTF
jgi:predicted dehydrogenase